jgi:hypothetical protein
MSLSDADASFIGEAVGDRSGWIRPAGDVNSDGFADILVSSWYNDEQGLAAGQVYLFLGSDTLQWNMDMSLSMADASFLGEAAGNQAGTNAHTVGDVNNDGFGDFVISAYHYGNNNIGKVYLFLGSDTLSLAMDMSVTEAHASFVGEVSGDAIVGLGHPGDVNGDSLDDLLFKSHINDEAGNNAGQVYLVLGREAADWGQNYSLSLADASFLGEAADDEAGHGGAAIGGDVNNDGLDDILIGAPFNDQAGNAVGKTYLILGRTAADWGMDFSLDSADATFLGENVDDGAGIEAVYAGDVNGDGFDDFLIGSDYSSDGGYHAGQTYLILGRTDADWGVDYQLSNADASFVGEADNHLTGQHSNSAGDVNGDGFDDFLINSKKYDGDKGKSYLILGDESASWGMDFDLANADASFIGEAAGDRAGIPSSSAGDINGDGLDDILIGSEYNDEGGSDAGQGYLILGDSLFVEVSIAERGNVLPSNFILYPAYPNPFNPITTIRYDLPHASEVTLIVSNLLGREVARLVDGYMEPGYHQVQWSGHEFASGIYIARLVTSGYSKSIKMMLLK